MLLNMATSKARSCIVLLLCAFMFAGFGQGAVQIVQPFPQGIWPIEDENAEVTCVAMETDPKGALPTIQFVRKDEYGFETVISDEGISGHTYFTNRTETNERKVFVTLHINNVRASDDRASGSYECKALSGAQVDRIGFTVSVISRRFLPQGSVTTSINVEYGGEANLTCNITNPGRKGKAELLSLVWIKDGRVVMNGTTSIGPYTITSANTRDGGTYRCMALVKVGFRPRPTPYEMGRANVTVPVTFVAAPSRFHLSVGRTARLVCPAEGFPLDIQWIRQTDDGREVVIPHDDERRVARRPCPYCRYELVISRLNMLDRGIYICRSDGSAGGRSHRFGLLISEYVPETATRSSEKATQSPTTAMASRVSEATAFVCLGFLCALVISW